MTIPKFTYQPPDDIVWLNTDDAILTPIPVHQLTLIRNTYNHYGMSPPDVWPEPDRVFGFGIAPEDQKFQREVTPRGLIELEKTIRYDLRPKTKSQTLTPARREIAVIDAFWNAIDENPIKYEEEVEWLRLMWYYRLFGKHLYINGKHTYITGQNWFYLNYWILNGVNTYPEYRDVDRRWWIGFKYCETSTETFVHRDPDTGLGMSNSDGTYDMKDLKRRVFYGGNFPKKRREGATSRLECAQMEFITRKVGGKGGIQAKDEDTGQEVVFAEHAVQPFIKLPTHLKPVFDTAAGIVPKNVLLFDSLDDVSFGLHSQIEVATSSSKSKFDGRYLHFYHGDEFGKLERSDPNDVCDVIKFCLSTGGGSQIHGISGITSTVEQVTEDSAGEKYKRFCDRSHWDLRDDIGQTVSGWVNIFFSAYDGLEDFIGPYGESVIDTPTPDQARFLGKDYGSRKYIDNKIAAYRKQKDWVGLAAFRRQYPTSYEECFIKPPSQQILRRDLIESQIQHLKTHPEEQAVRGNFMWANGKDSTVLWIPDPDGGRFLKSRNFLPNEINNRISKDGMFHPADKSKYVGSPDTIGINKPATRKSNPGLVIRWRRDSRIDPDDKEQDMVESETDIITYKFRPETVNEFLEDMIMAHVYCGAMCYPEKNRTNVEEYFKRRGYGGYLLYDFNPKTGKFKDTAGWWNHNYIVDENITKLAQDIVKNVHRCKHLPLLEEYLTFGGRQTLTDHDLIAAKLGTLIAEENAFFKYYKSRSNKIDVTGWTPWEPEL